MKPKQRSTLLLAVASCLVLILTPATLHAQTAWTGGGGDNDYSNNLNWAGDIIPGDGNDNGALIGSGSTQSVIYNTPTSYTSIGTAVTNILRVGAGNNGVGSLTLSGDAGTLTFGGDSFFNAAQIGSTGGTTNAIGMVTVSAGKLSITGADEASMNLGVSLNGNASTVSGTLIIDGGTVEVGRRILMGANRDTTTGVLTISSGTLDMISTGTGSDLGMIRLGTGNNTVNLDGGTVIFRGFHTTDASAARSTIFMNGTTLRANANIADLFNGTTANTNLLVKDAGLVMDTNSFNVTINDALSNAAGNHGTLTKQGAGTLTLSNNGSTFTGNVSVTGGTLSLSGQSNTSNPVNTAIGNATVARNITVESGAVLQFAANDVMGSGSARPAVTLIANGGTITSNGTKFSTLGALELNGGTLSANNGVNATFQAWSLTDTVTVGGSAASNITTTGTNAGIHLGSSLNNLITFNVANATGDSNPDLIVAARLINRNTGQGGGAGGLIKDGAGTMLLTETNFYTDTTTVNAGTLLINGSTSTSSAVTVASAGRLGGTGTVGGNTSVSGTLAPGNSIATLSFSNNLTFNSGSVFDWEMNYAAGDAGVRGTNYDAVNVSGMLGGIDAVFSIVLPGSTNFADSFWLASHSWSDIFGSQTIEGIFSSYSYFNTDGAIAAPDAMTQGSFTISGTNLQWTAIPEPSTAMLSLLLCFGLLRRRR